ncbi:MAG: GTPase HflX [Alphaproteobacteria bacterium]|nr:GTPase HflX [Alphaproteobacteria bacterium]
MPSRPSCRSIRCSSSSPRKKQRRLPADLTRSRKDTADPRPGEDPPDRKDAGADRTGRAVVLHPDLTPYRGRDRGEAEEGLRRAPEDRLEEAVGLARAIGLEIAAARIVTITTPRPATLMGEGKVAEIGALLAETHAGLVVVDGPLSPGQQRNLEKAWSAKVIDRTGLILEIFGERARTREGQLQVELAHLTYQKSRLVRSWTHLERQRGALGKLGGPGETQIEADRRLIGERIVRLKKDLAQVTRTRALHRESRQAVPFPVVALVGYTNAGKSTLFNRLSRADVLVKDMLFATLDPTMRLVRLPSGRRIILSDTVGFISDLPTQLVAAFRATLEEVCEADLLLHVRDVSSPSFEAEGNDVHAVLAELGIDETAPRPTIEIFNKLDRLEGPAREQRIEQCRREPLRVALSALTGEGVDALLAQMDEELGRGEETVDLEIDAADGPTYAWLHANTQVIFSEARDARLHLRVRAGPLALGRLRKSFSERARILPHAAH